MKRLFRIFELSRNEQRVVLIIMLILIAIAFVGYQRRSQRPHIHPTAATEAKPFSSPSEIEDEH
jgi:hypothetical protein